MSSPSTLLARSNSLVSLEKASSLSIGWFSNSTSWYSVNFPASWEHAAALAALSEPLPPRPPSISVTRWYSTFSLPASVSSFSVER